MSNIVKMSRDIKSCPGLNIHDWDWVAAGHWWLFSGAGGIWTIGSSVLRILSDQTWVNMHPIIYTEEEETIFIQ